MNSTERPIVVIGVLGSTLDAGYGPKRWERWRPTVAICQHPDLLVQRFELLYQKKFTRLCDRVVKDIQQVSPETDVTTHLVEYDDPWDLEQVYNAQFDFARSYPFDVEREDYLVHITTGTHIAQICTYLLTESRHLPARILQTSPPTKETPSISGTFRVIDLDLSRYDRIAQRFQQEQKEGLSFLKAGIDTRNHAFNKMIEQIERVAIASNDPILLTGPTGAGKSQLARRIYDLKKLRRQIRGRFVDVNCATIRGDGAMSSLFGHTRGAFTGADKARAGYIKQADNGMLFLDEIGELGVDEQAMLLRAVEEKVFFPVGSDVETQSDFQLIAGTNRDLAQEIQRGAFREDLLSRINLWTYELPGLRDRREDIEPNLDYELTHVGRALNINLTMNREARARFLDFATAPRAMWKGNFRDLNGAVRRMATLCQGGRITTDDVESEIARLSASWSGAATESADSERVSKYLGTDEARIDLFDRVQLGEVLRVCEESRSLAEAGRRLFAVSRTEKKTSNDSDRVRKFLKKFGLGWRDIQS